MKLMPSGSERLTVAVVELNVPLSDPDPVTGGPVTDVAGTVVSIVVVVEEVTTAATPPPNVT